MKHITVQAEKVRSMIGQRRINITEVVGCAQIESLRGHSHKSSVVVHHNYKPHQMLV